MSADRAKKSEAAAKAPRGANPRRPTQAQSIARQQQIVHEHDVERLTFGEIAKRHAMGEKEVRAAYARQVNEIAPLFASAPPVEKAYEYLRELEDVRQRLAQISDHADNDSARVGALRARVSTIFQEIALRQALGLLPRDLGDLRVIADQEWLAQEIGLLLQRYGVPPDAFAELESIFSGESNRVPEGES